MAGQPCDHPPQAGGDAWQFGSLVISELQRRIEVRGSPVRIGPRSFELLMLLVKHAGEFVGNRHLLSAAWAGVVVEDASVRVHISLIRKALGTPLPSDGCLEWISNVPLRGYRFNGQLTSRRSSTSVTNQTANRPALTVLPSRLTTLVGRQATVDEVASLMQVNRLVTIVGPGGIGKTSIAVCVAVRLQAELGIPAAFADFSPLVSPEHVPDAVARALGVPAGASDAIDAIHSNLVGRPVLLVADNCEHVLGPLAATVDRLLSRLPGLRVLATSRESLQLPGERLIRLLGLDLPAGRSTSLEQLSRSPAAELLLARAKAAGAADFNEGDTEALAAITRQLQGVPLAIELVAAQLGKQPARDLALRLQDHARLLSIGRRGAFDRQRSLAAALDWSMALLDEKEAQLLRALSAFRGRFDMEAALAICMGKIEPDDALDALSSLVDKSLVMFDPSSQVAPYRLLDTTRAYAASHAARVGEEPMLLQRHAAHMLDAMRAATAELPLIEEAQWGERHVHRLDDVRFALRNSLADSGDLQVAAALVAASSPLWFHASLLAEYRDGVAATLAAMESRRADDAMATASLSTALLVAMLHTDALSPSLDGLWLKAISAARQAEAPVFQLQALWGRCTYEMFRGEYPLALRHADELMQVIMPWGDAAALNLAHRTCAMANHLSGRLAISSAHSHASLLIGEHAPRTPTNMVGVDPIVAAKAMLSRTQWLQGDIAQALETAIGMVERARQSKHSLSLCAALFGACPVALWSGQKELAGEWIELMRKEATRRGLGGWLRFPEWYHDGWRLLFEDAAAHRRKVRELLPGFEVPRQEMLATFSVDWVAPSLMARVLAGESAWCAAEVWRGEARRHAREGNLGEAEACLNQAMALALEQGAAAWHWRASYDLARLLIRRGEHRQASSVVRKVLANWPRTDSAPLLKRIERLASALFRRIES